MERIAGSLPPVGRGTTKKSSMRPLPPSAEDLQADAESFIIQGNQKGDDNMRIVPMEARHAAQAAELERRCFSKPWSEQALLDECENPNAVFLAAVEGDRLLGYCGMHFAAGECYMDNLAVSPERRREGIGEGLILALLKAAKERGGEFLSLEVRPSNAGAVALYKKLGFQVVGRRTGFYTAPREDALLMTRPLKESIEEELQVN